MNDISKEPTFKLLHDLDELEDEIELYEEKKKLTMLKYNFILAELTKRVPTLEDFEEFKPKGYTDENTRK